MKLKYVGPHDAVDLIDVGTVARGEAVEVTGPAAESLCKQADWQRVGTKTTTKTPAKSATNTED